MNETLTPTLDAIAAHGNHGHHHRNQSEAVSRIVCGDGTALKVRAGNGLTTDPYVLPCCEDEWPDCDQVPPQAEIVSHDYPGPYTAVEVRTNEPELLEMLGITWPFPEIEFLLEVETVRQFIVDHGGEFNPIAEAESILANSTNTQE